MVGEVESLVAALHSSLLKTDRELQELGAEEEVLEAWLKMQQGQVENHFHSLAQKVDEAKGRVLEQLAQQADLLRSRRLDRAQQLATSSYQLQPELDALQEAMAASPTTRDQFSVSSCRARLSKKLAPAPPPQPLRPTFHPSQALFRLRASDFGFLQMAEFMPADFSLVLSSPSLTVGSNAICTVLTPCYFTDAIQANIKFSIKCHQSKEAVLFCRKDCRVSPDLKTFQLAFPLLQPGTYTLTVLLYEQHIQASPLSITVGLQGSQGPLSPFSPAWNNMQKQLEQFHIPSPLLSNSGPHLPVHTPTLPDSYLPRLSSGFNSQQQRLTIPTKDFCPPVCSTSNLDQALQTFFPEGVPVEAESVKEKDNIELLDDGGQSEKMGQLLRGEGDGGEASRPTSRPASPSKSSRLEGVDDAVVNDEVQDLTRRVVEVSIDGEAQEEVGDQTTAIDPDMVVERLVRRKEERVSSRDYPNAREIPSHHDFHDYPPFTKQSSADGVGQNRKQHLKAQPGSIRFGGERLVDENQSTKYRASEELDFRQLREDLEADMKKFNKASKPEAAAALSVKGISRCPESPLMGERQFAKSLRPTENREDEHSNARGGLPKFPPAASVRPSPPLSTVDLPVMLSSRPAGRTAISAVTMCLRAPKLRQHVPESIHGPIGICLLQDKCVVVSSTFEDQVKMFTGCGQFLRLVEAEPGRRFKHPSDMVALRDGGFAVRDQLTVRCYDRVGRFQRRLDPTFLDRFYGLAEDNEGRLVTINENKGGRVRERSDGTRAGESDLLFFNLSTGSLVKRVELADVIADKEKSKCRFLTRGFSGSLVITDLGMDRVYILDLVTKGVKMFGHTGSGPGCFKDPAGLAVDSVGNMLVADSKNHRLCLHDSNGRFLTEVKLDPSPKRPSGLLLDQENGDIYLLNLQGEAAVTRYSLQIE